MAELIFKLPTKQTPDFLRRCERAVALKERLQSGITSKLIGEIVAFLGDYCENPKLLWDASEEDFDTLLNALLGIKAEG